MWLAWEIVVAGLPPLCRQSFSCRRAWKATCTSSYQLIAVLYRMYSNKDNISNLSSVEPVHNRIETKLSFVGSLQIKNKSTFRRIDFLRNINNSLEPVLYRMYQNLIDLFWHTEQCWYYYVMMTVIYFI